MKNTYLYGVLMCLFLLMGKVEVAYGQDQWYESATWTDRTINENMTISLTQDVELNGTIKISEGYTLTINNSSGKAFTIQAVANKTMFSNSGSFIIKGDKNSRIVLDGGANFEWSDNHSEMPYMRLTEGEGSKKIGDAIYNVGSLSLSYVTIQNVNSSNDNGGAIQTKSKQAVSLDHCIIQLCKARLGSAVMLDGGASGAEEVALKISNSLITKCVSGGDASYKANNVGGAIRTYGSTKSSLYLTNVVMSYNYAMREYGEYNNRLVHDGNGGALFWNGRGTESTKCVIDGCIFEYNKSDDNGGAIKAQGTIQFVNNKTSIRNNQAPNGGGLYIEGYTGGVKVGKPCIINYDLNEYLDVSDNIAPSYNYNNETIDARGAGVHFYFGTDMTLDDGSTINVNMNGATIQNNTINGGKGLGGGIYFEDTALDEKNYTFNINLNYGRLLNNTSTAFGGGMYISEGDVTSETKEGKEMVVTGNTALQDGGGIYIGDGSFIMNTKGMINENEATQGNGGGIYVGGDFTMMSGTISGNEASYGDGGGAYINGGNFTMNDGIITQNIVTQGDGGGVYINRGNFMMNNGIITENVVTQGDGGGVFVDGGTLSFNNGSITSNQAGLQHNGNGGGICLLDGRVGIEDGTISKNESGQYGGGLYVYNSEEDEQDASFTGGYIVKNKARYGGGVCVNGNINLEIGTVTVDENTAINGGGICLLNGARMDFGQGFIRENKAATTDTWQGGTAYQKSITEVKGIGGGVYLDSNTSLTFSVVNELGLYDNFADYGADDVFANGDRTTVSYKNEDNVVEGLPVVSTMKLAGFAVAGEPYWVEDYIAGDDGYASGTNKKLVTDDVCRYRASIQNLKEVYKIESSEDLTDASKKYLCLAIGHDIVYVTIIKKGLVAGESAIFTVKLIKDNKPALDDIKRVVLLTGNGNESVSKKVALSTGIWEVEETNWTWAYTPKPESNKIQRATVYNGFEFIFENMKKETLPLHDEAKKENFMSVPTNNNTGQ